jgi:hypothetical protein
MTISIEEKELKQIIEDQLKPGSNSKLIADVIVQLINTENHNQESTLKTLFLAFHGVANTTLFKRGQQVYVKLDSIHHWRFDKNVTAEKLNITREDFMKGTIVKSEKYKLKHGAYSVEFTGYNDKEKEETFTVELAEFELTSADELGC